MQDQSSTVSFCPSFSAYSSDNQLTEIATRVVNREAEESRAQLQTRNGENEYDDDFEFILLRAHPDDSAVNFEGTEGFVSFPLFNRDLLTSDRYAQGNGDGEAVAAEAAARPIMLSLRTLMIEERGNRYDDGEGSPSASSSSSEADELEGIPEGSYCVWAPKPSPPPSPSLSQQSPARCKKSYSTGSTSSAQSKRHRWLPLRDLLRRSKSDGKQSLLFLAPNNNRSETILNSKKKEEDPAEGGKKGESKTARKGKVVSAHEVFYVRKKDENGGKRKSYLPYRPELVGFFANPNLSGMGRSFIPF